MLYLLLPCVRKPCYFQHRIRALVIRKPHTPCLHHRILPCRHIGIQSCRFYQNSQPPAHRRIADRLFEQPDLSSCRIRKSAEHLQGRRFPCPVSADESIDAAFAYLQCKIFYRRLFAVHLRKGIGLYGIYTFSVSFHSLFLSFPVQMFCVHNTHNSFTQETF